MDKEQLVIKWLNNELSEAESKAFASLKDADLYQEIVDEVQRFDGHTHAQVVPFDALDLKLETDSKSSFNWIRVVSGLAAIFVISLALITFLNRTSISTFSTDLAKTEIITLPDNSKVTLNELSEIAYNSSNWSDNRMLELRGEAHFDVAKGKKFDVNTPFGVVSVLGTEFNVLSRDSIFKVSCYEGLVRVSYNDKAINLPAGTELSVRSGKDSTSEIAIAEPYWIKNMSVFENASFNEVVLDLEKHYSVKVQLPPLNTMKFTGAFEHNNLDNALKSITLPFNLTYEILNTNEVLIKDVQK